MPCVDGMDGMDGHLAISSPLQSQVVGASHLVRGRGRRPGDHWIIRPPGFAVFSLKEWGSKWGTFLCCLSTGFFGGSKVPTPIFHRLINLGYFGNVRDHLDKPQFIALLGGG